MIRYIGIGARGYKRGDGINRTVITGRIDRGPTVLALEIQVSPRRNQGLDRFNISIKTCPMQRGPAILVTSAQISPRIQQDNDRISGFIKHRKVQWG